MGIAKTVFLASLKIFGPSMVGILLLGGISYLSIQARNRADLENEIIYYEGKNNYVIDSNFNWEEFKKLDGYFFRVSKQGLRKKSSLVISNHGICRMFVDHSNGVMWISGFMNIQLEEPKIFIYYWMTSPGEVYQTIKGKSA
jgi:hypothetical protein